MLRHDFCRSDGRLVKLLLSSTLVDKSPLTFIYFTIFEKKRRVRSPLSTQPNFLVFGKISRFLIICVTIIMNRINPFTPKPLKLVLFYATFLYFCNWVRCKMAAKERSCYLLYFLSYNGVVYKRRRYFGWLVLGKIGISLFFSEGK